MKKIGKDIICECPRCEKKLKIFIMHKDCLGDILASNNYVCSECNKSFNLSEALNLITTKTTSGVNEIIFVRKE